MLASTAKIQQGDDGDIRIKDMIFLLLFKLETVYVLSRLVFKYVQVYKYMFS